MTLEARDLAFAYSPGTEVLSSVSLSLPPGTVTFILGANGTGKTTLLECLFGLRAPLRGQIAVQGRSLREMTARERARQIGLVPQLHEPVFEFTVQQAVLMGRAPHLNLFARPGPEDLRAAAGAMQAVGVDHLADRPYTRISGGERQLALIARGLAQGAQWLLMDEPAAHLDPHHQHQVLTAVRRLAGEGLGFAITSHLPNHALLYADQIAFLVHGKTEIQGRPETTITEHTLQAAYGMGFEIVQGTSGARAAIPRQS